MEEQVRASFNQIKELVNRVARETGSDLLVHRIRRKKAITFEIVPKGSPYGPRLRLSEDQLRNPVFVQQTLEVKGITLKQDVVALQESMKTWEPDD